MDTQQLSLPEALQALIDSSVWSGALPVIGLDDFLSEPLQGMSLSSMGDNTAGMVGFLDDPRMTEIYGLTTETAVTGKLNPRLGRIIASNWSEDALWLDYRTTPARVVVTHTTSAGLRYHKVADNFDTFVAFHLSLALR